MDETLRPLFRSICLENTRLLVKGVARLHQGYEGTLRKKDNGNPADGKEPWRLGNLRKFVVEEYRESIRGGNYLAQNPYVELFRFRRPKPDVAWMEDLDSPRLSGMILLYHQLQILEELPADRLMEAYEILCNSIRSILEADMCYLVSRQLTDTSILCSSSVLEVDLNEQLGSREAGELLDRLGVEEEFLRLTEGVFLKQRPEADVSGDPPTEKNMQQEPDVLILPIVLYDKKGKPWDEQVHLICHRRGKPFWSQDAEKTLLRVRDTLFLRGHLAQALARDLTSLMTAARDYRDICRKTSMGSPVKILHISDLHVTKENCERLKEYIQRLKLESGPFDFLAITGDVVQGRYAAGDLEQHYDCAAQVIRCLAFRMWSEEEDGQRILCQDWKRRTIVIPGNHDYASMNELETQHGESHRASEGGRPAAQEGSAMAKFTYYINFIRKLLGVEVGTLIDNGLNELRRYDKIGVDFLCFNTSIMANPARNNKVHLDQNFAQRAIRRLALEQEKRITIFLGHHGPDYKIDYVSDEYLEPFICRKITDDFVNALQTEKEDERKRMLEQLDRDMGILMPDQSGDNVNNEFVQVWLLRNQVKRLPEDVTAKVIARRKKTRLYNHLTFLLEQLRKGEAERSINERYQKIIAEVNRAKLLSENDKKAYDTVFHMLVSELNLTVCLSGHTHVWDVAPDKKPHFVAKRFLWERMDRDSDSSDTLQRIPSLHYGVCEIIPEGTGDGPKVVYQPINEDVP